jgi:uncharacterized protein (TIGR02217 family)
MAEFLDEVLPVNVRMGASYTDAYDVKIVQTASGSEYRELTHPFPVRSFHINFTLLRDEMMARVLAVYHRAYGMYAGFRVKCLDDFSTNNHRDVPTSTDWILPKISSGVYQLIKGYGSGGTPLGIGLPYRNIYKPETGTVLVSKDNVTLSSGVSVDHSTGRVTITPAPTTEVIMAGCYFHIPCRFNSKIEVSAMSADLRDLGGVDLLELLNP